MSFVTCKLWAQAGNQMFMIAATIAHALKHGVDYKIPREGHSPELPMMPFPWLPAWTPADGLGAPYVEEQDQFGIYHEMPYWPKMRLHGYFQSEKYFSNYRQEILEAFRIPWHGLNGVIGVHVRRGDYLQHPTKHPVVTKDYITQAFQQFPGGYQYKFFSDDIQWCKETFPGHSYSEGRPALEDMSFMSCCEHQIISNSTFSWWAAWLNQNPHKQIITPSHKNWFGPGNSALSTKDLIPESWIQIQY